MKLILEQRIFSWLDTYDIYDENHEVMYQVIGKLSWSHKLEIYDKNQVYMATLVEKVLTFLPKIQIYKNEEKIGEIHQEFTFFKPVFTIDINDWVVEGDLMGWDYQIISNGRLVARISKKIFNVRDVYEIDIENNEDNLLCLLVVLAIDIIKCSQRNN